MSSKLTSKLPEAGLSIFAIMSKMAVENNAINLSQGFPDFDVSPELISLIHKYMQKGLNQYAPMPGVPALREAIAQMIFDTRQVSVHPDSEITITSGATEAIFDIITATIRNKEEVIVFDPSYDCYDPAIRLCGGIPIHLNLTLPDYSIDWEQVKKTITKNTRMIIVNTPHNPSGSVLTAADLQQLDQIVKDTDILILSDEVYEHIIFDGLTHESVLKYPNLKERSAAVYSFGKTFHATGWKMGYVIAPEWWTHEIRKIHQFVTFSTNTPIQHALADFIASPNNYNEVAKMYEQKRNYFTSISSTSKFKAVACSGTYFQLLSYKNVEALHDLSDIKAAEKLTIEYGLASIPVSVFNHNKQDDKMLRFCFAKGKNTLEKAANILCKI